jgi:DNA invertase Pin-like site-specific DNA recombinase
MPIAGAVLGIAGGLMKAFGQKKQAKAQAKAEKLNAELIRERTKVELTLAKRAGIKGIGATRADYGAAGLKQLGSAGDVLRESARDIAAQLASIKKLGKLEEQMHLQAAKAATAGGTLGMIGGILSSVGSGMGGM